MGVVQYALFVIPQPKTRRTSARIQSARVEPSDVVELLSMAFKTLAPDERLWPASTSTFRAPFRSLGRALKLLVDPQPGGDAHLSLASLRGGGAFSPRRIGRWSRRGAVGSRPAPCRFTCMSSSRGRSSPCRRAHNSWCSVWRALPRKWPSRQHVCIAPECSLVIGLPTLRWKSLRRHARRAKCRPSQGQRAGHEIGEVGDWGYWARAPSASDSRAAPLITRPRKPLAACRCGHVPAVPRDGASLARPARGGGQALATLNEVVTQIARFK